jgi:hypothetical protein
MPKLNVVAMIVLSLSIAAGAAVMSLRATAPRPDPQVDRLIRRLADTDPDLRREAERELKELGSMAAGALKQAAEGSDPVVAERARVLLGAKRDELPRETPGAVEPVSLPEPAVRLSLQLGSSPRRPREHVLYYLRLHNGTQRSMAIARRVRDGRPDYGSFGGFERIDADGRVVELEDTVDAPAGGEVEVVLVAPGETVDLFPGAGLLRIGASGTFRVRYVYDATEGSEYRERVGKGHFAGSALAAERFESNAVTVTIP